MIFIEADLRLHGRLQVKCRVRLQIRVRYLMRVMDRVRFRVSSHEAPGTIPIAEQLPPERLSLVYKGGCWRGLAFGF